MADSPDYAPYSSVDADGRYTQLIGRDGLDEPIDVRHMTERNEGDVAARFDRLPLEYVIDADDIGDDRVDLLGEVSDDGATIALSGNISALSRIEDGTVDLDDLRVGNYLRGSTDYAMFTAERVSDDQVVVHAYPTDDVFGTYEVDD